MLGARYGVLYAPSDGVLAYYYSFQTRFRSPPLANKSPPTRSAAHRHLRRGRGLRLGLLTSPGLGCASSASASSLPLVEVEVTVPC